MKRYKCLNGRDYNLAKTGEIYNEDYCPFQCSPDSTVKKTAEDYPEDWELIEEEFILPKNWFIRVDSSNKEIINKWKLKQYCNDSLYIYNYDIVTNDGSGDYSNPTEMYQEITFEQFKKYVLKENNMKIIAYKIKEEFIDNKNVGKILSIIEGNHYIGTGIVDYGSKIYTENVESISKLKDSGAIEMYMEPVYEKEFEIGDWIYIVNNGSSMQNGNYLYGSKPGDIVKINSIIFSGEYASENDPRYCGYNFNLRSRDFREATQQEIESAQVKFPKIGDWVGSLSKNHTVIHYGCKHLRVNEVKNLIKLNCLSLEIRDEDDGKTYVITSKDLKQMIEYVEDQL